VFVAIRDLRFAKGRFALMGTVVTLITLLVVPLRSHGRAGPRQHLRRHRPARRPPGVLGARLRSQAGVHRLLHHTLRAGRLVPRRGRSTGRARHRRHDPGRGQRTHRRGRALHVPAGSPLAPGVGADQVVLSTKAADALDVAAGERIDVAGQSVTIAAVSGDDEFSHAPVIWAATTTVPLSGQKPGNATFLALTTDGSTFDSAAMDTADQRLGTTTLTPAQSLSAIGSYTSENGSLQLMRALLFAISALVIGAFFTVWTVQRSGEIAILKALGASTGYLLKDALGQALALLALGTVLGTALAAGIGAGITALAGSAVPFVLNLPTLLLPAVVMIVLGLAGAAASLHTVTTVDPLTALGSAR